MSDEDVRKIESKLGVQFPEDYAEFLRTVNANQISTSYFKAVKGNLYFGNFLHQQMDLPYSMVNLNYNMARAHDDDNDPVIGKDYLWFAGDHGGEPILMSLQEKNKGEIYFLRSDLTFEEGAQLLAYSFTHFLEILRDNEGTEPEE